MSLKDEIDKLISAERELLKTGDVKKQEFAEQQRMRFRPLRAALEEVLKAVDSSYFMAEFRDEQVTIDLIQTIAGSPETCRRWTIEPASAPNLECEPGDAFFEARPGFTVKIWISNYPFDQPFESDRALATESEVIELFVNDLAQLIASCQHLEEKCRERRKGSD